MIPAAALIEKKTRRARVFLRLSVGGVGPSVPRRAKEEQVEEEEPMGRPIMLQKEE